MGDFSSFLFVQPSFLRGAARLGDLSGSLNQLNVSRDAAEADRRALCSDGLAVRQDIENAVRKLFGSDT